MPTTFTTAKAPRASQSGVPIYADTAQLSALARNLRRASPEAWKACRVSLKALASPLLAEMQGTAATFSTRIPATGRIKVTSGGNVKITFGGEAAPNAAPIENKGKGHVRHPVPHTDQWTDKNSPPAFMAPILAAHIDRVAEGMTDAVMTAIDRALKAL